jgi:hypothetical protein
MPETRQIGRLTKLVRCLLAIFVASGSATAASNAHASMACFLLDDFPNVLDPLVREQLETHVKALPGLKDYQIKDIDGRFFIVMADDGYCKEGPRCEHRLLDLRNGVVKNVFGFRGKG